MSYYNARNPGLILYLILLIGSVYAFLYMEPSYKVLGVMAILWGGFIMMRVLALFEISEHTAPLTTQAASKNNNAQSAALAYDLSKRMSNTKNYKSGLKALYAINPRTILWLILAGTYVGYTIYMQKDTLSTLDIIQYITVSISIGAAFWAGQSYAHSEKAGDIMILVFTGLLGLSMYKTGILFPDAILNLPSLTPTNIILSALVVYSGTVILFGLRAGLRNAMSILIGIMLLILFSMSFIQLDHSTQNAALWLSGWSLFSVFWVRSFVYIRKEYILYQCE